MGSSKVSKIVPNSTSPLRLGRYELILRIGHGGVGQVYLARATGVGGFERLFAIKMIHPHLSSSPAFARALIHEAHLASQISHHNTVSVFDVGVYQDTHFLVMEYIDGCSLAELCRASLDFRPPDRLGPIMMDALYGLQAAHDLKDEEGRSVKLIHRDFSPPNLLIGVDGTCRVTDFGIARTNTLSQHTNPGTIKGKPSYMAPEQVTGGEIDQRTDIFAAGVILWNALTGKRLFDGPSEAATMYNVLRRQIPNPSEIGLKPDPAFDAVIMKALQRRPEFRFQSAGEMAEALREALLRTGNLGSSKDVGNWITSLFGERLAARAQRLRGADNMQVEGSDALEFQFQLGSLVPSAPQLRVQSSSSGRAFSQSLLPPVDPVSFSGQLEYPGHNQTANYRRNTLSRASSLDGVRQNLSAVRSNTNASQLMDALTAEDLDVVQDQGASSSVSSMVWVGLMIVVGLIGSVVGTLMWLQSNDVVRGTDSALSPRNAKLSLQEEASSAPQTEGLQGSEDQAVEGSKEVNLGSEKNKLGRTNDDAADGSERKPMSEAQRVKNKKNTEKLDSISNEGRSIRGSSSTPNSEKKAGSLRSNSARKKVPKKLDSKSRKRRTLPYKDTTPGVDNDIDSIFKNAPNPYDIF